MEVWVLIYETHISRYLHLPRWQRSWRLLQCRPNQPKPVSCRQRRIAQQLRTGSGNSLRTWTSKIGITTVSIVDKEWHLKNTAIDPKTNLSRVEKKMSVGADASRPHVPVLPDSRMDVDEVRQVVLYEIFARHPHIDGIPVQEFVSHCVQSFLRDCRFVREFPASEYVIPDL